MSGITQRIVSEIESAPETFQGEVLDFVILLKSRQSGSSPAKTFIRHTPGVCGGEACVRNTRIAVWMLEEAKRAGISETDLMADYPDLTREDLEAAWAYALNHPQEIENAIQANQDL